MGTQRGIPAEFIPANNDIEEVFFSTDSKGNTNSDDKIDAMRNALNTDPEAFITVHRSLGGGNSPEEYVKRFPADKFDFGQLQDYLQVNYGHGDYRIRLYAHGKLVSNRLISIANTVKKDVVNNQTGETAGILATVLERMEANNARMMQMMQHMTQPQDESATLQKMLLYKQLFSTPSNGGGLSQITETLSVLKELGLQIGGAEKEDSGFTNLLEKMTPVIANVMTQPRTHAPQPNNQQPKQEPKNVNISQMQIVLGTLIKAASKNSNQMTYAEWLLDQIPEEIIRDRIMQEGALESLITYAPTVGQYRPWFDTLIEHLKAQFGLPSKVSDLYHDDIDDITGEDNLTGNINDV